MEQHSRLTKREQTIYNILTAAIGLFRKNGFENTSIRQIAEAAHVSLGMVNHYFISKEYLGAQVLQLLSDHAAASLPDSVSWENNPILYDLALVRIRCTFLLEQGYKEFYLDSLRKDFFFNFLAVQPVTTLERLQTLYHFEANRDDQLLYSKYLPYMTEKTLMLKKEEGLFTTIKYDEIPFRICLTSMNRYIPETDVRAHDAQSRQIAKDACKTLSPLPSEEEILTRVRQLDQNLKEAASGSREYMLQLMHI